MNRALFITIAIVIIILVFVVWLFLFINGAPANTREVFADLGIVGQTERPAEVVVDEVSGRSNATILSLNENGLEQITTSPVAGFGLASTSDGTILRYIERGTGYIFEINTRSSAQTQVTPSTIANAVEAYFAPDLSSVVVVTELEAKRQVSVLELPATSESEAVRSNLGTDIENIEYLTPTQIAFTRNSYIETVGYTYDLETKVTAEHFRLPVSDAVVVTTENNNVFTHPKVTSLFTGALYEVTGGGVVPASQSAFGLTAFIDGGIGIVSYVDGRTYRSYRLPSYTLQPILMLAEKCAATLTPDVVVCGAPNSETASTYVENWYKGLHTFNDYLWRVNTSSQEAALLSIPTEHIGRQIDVINMTAAPSEDKFFFQNKIDATLWLFNL